MNTSKLLRTIISIMLLAVLLTACSGAPAVEETDAVEEPVVEEEAVVEEEEEEAEEEEVSMVPDSVQFCTVYSTSIQYNSWDKTGHESFLRFMENPGIDIEVKELRYAEGLWGDEAEAAIREFAESGCDILWGHGGYNDIILNIYPDYPEVMFAEIGSGWIDGDENNYHYMYRCNDGAYLMGVLAGLLSEGTGIGAVGGYPAEDVNDAINGFFAGAKSVNPDLQQKVGFVNSWYDPVLAAEVAEAQKAVGVDMLLMHAENFDVCGPDTGAMCFASYDDMSVFYPGAVIASDIATWEPAYEWALGEWVKFKETGEWNGGHLGFENNMFSGACTVKLGDGIEETLPADVLEQFNAIYEAILSGELVPELNISEPISD